MRFVPAIVAMLYTVLLFYVLAYLVLDLSSLAPLAVVLVHPRHQYDILTSLLFQTHII